MRMRMSTCMCMPHAAPQLCNNKQQWAMAGTAELRARIAELAVGARVELRVVSVARNNEVLLGKNRPPTFSSGRTCPI